MSAPNDKNTPEPLSFAAFLESVPPGAERRVSDLGSPRNYSIAGQKNQQYVLQAPDILLHCANNKCRGDRIFESDDGKRQYLEEQPDDVFLNYTCRNCRKGSKTYALQVRQEQGRTGFVAKYGERPAFGPPLPPRLIDIFGDDRELFMKGRRTESQSLGIGAFVYYRRVVENQKDRLLEEIRKAAERLGADTDLLDSIDRAKGETQFSKAIELVKDAIPDGLKVQGENPLTLLHRVLSRGVHGLDDRECLERAQAVRRVLTELVSNITQVTKNERELTDAVKKLRSVK